MPPLFGLLQDMTGQKIHSPGLMGVQEISRFPARPPIQSFALGEIRFGRPRRGRSPRDGSTPTVKALLMPLLSATRLIAPRFLRQDRQGFLLEYPKKIWSG